MDLAFSTQSLRRGLVLGGAAAALGMSTVSHAALFSEDYESQTVGDQPTGMTALRPTSNSATTHATIVEGAANTAGGGAGKGLQLFDDDGSSAFAYEVNFVGDTASQTSTAHISYDLAWNSDLGDTSYYGRFGVGAYDASTGATLNSSGNIYLEIRWGSEGKFRVVGSSGNSVAQLVLDQANAIDIYVNDSDSVSIDYLDPNGATTALAANSFAVYVNSSLVRTDGLENGALTGDSNLGRAGVVSFGSHVGIDYTLDNFVIDTIAVPEPGSLMLIGAGVLAIFRRGRPSK